MLYFQLLHILSEPGFYFCDVEFQKLVCRFTEVLDFCVHHPEVLKFFPKVIVVGDLLPQR